jgi:hypothetical protein
LLYDNDKKKAINRNTIYTGRVNNISFKLLYFCKDAQCSIEKSDIEDYFYKFQFIYMGCRIDHENRTNPIRPQAGYIKIPFYSNNPLITILKWQVVKYSDRRTFSYLWNILKGYDKEKIGGFIQSHVTYLVNSNKSIIYYIGTNRYKLLSHIILVNDHNEFMEYKRKFKNIFDVITNIGSLFLTIFSIVKSIFYFHTINYNNYRIMEKILLKEKKPNFELIDKNVSEQNEQIKIMEEVIEHENPDSNLINVDNLPYYSDDMIKPSENSNKNQFPKVCCLSYILNTIYCDCCKYKNCYLNSQEFLTKCNEIIYKYLSVDNILYNQLKLENLFNDYIWNNPKLKEIDNINIY